MGQALEVDNGPKTAKTLQSAVEAGKKEPQTAYESKVKATERHPLLDNPNPETQKMIMESSRAIIARGLSDGSKLIPQITELLNSKDQSVRADAVKTLGAIGGDLLVREGGGNAGARKVVYEARIDILTNLARLASNEKESKELTSSARKAAVAITTPEEQKQLRTLDSKLADAILGPEESKSGSKLKLPK